MAVTDRTSGYRAELAFKAPCRVATTANITLSGTQTIDGVAVVADDRVLVKDQTDQTANGIYVVSSGVWSRAVDFNSNDDMTTGTRVYVTSGTDGDGEYILTTAEPIVLGTSNFTFVHNNFGTALGITAAYSTRAAFVTAVSGGTSFNTGSVIDAGGVSYVKDGGTDIWDLSGWSPFGVATPVHFGADGTQYGDELVTNGTFDTDTTGWTANANVTIAVVANQLVVTSATDLAASKYCYQEIDVTAGQTYYLSYNFVAEVAAGNLRLGDSINGTDYLDASSPGTGTLSFVPTGSSVFVTCAVGSAQLSGATATFDSISIKRQADFSAFQDLIDSTTNGTRPMFHVPAGTYAGTLASLSVGTRNVTWIEQGHVTYSTSAPPGRRSYTSTQFGSSDQTWMVGGLALVPQTGTLGESVLLVRQDTDVDATIGNVAQIQRIVDEDTGLSNPKALRVYTSVNVDTASTEWAFSAELDTYSDTASTGNTACSATAKKYGLATAFAGHFNTIDTNTFDNRADVTSIIGIEVHAAGIGRDHPTQNGGNGLRISADVKAKTPPNDNAAFNEWAATTAYTLYDQIVATGTTQTAPFTGWYYECTTAGTSAGSEPTFPTTIGSTVADGTAVWTARRGNEQGVGVRVKCQEGTAGRAYFRYGVSIEDDYDGSNDNVMLAALKIQTRGTYGVYMDQDGRTYDIYMGGDSTVGIYAAGNYSLAAYQMAATERFAFNNAANVYMTYAGTGILTFVGSGNGYSFDDGVTFGSATAAAIADAGDAINTSGKTVGKMILDSTNYRLMIATGANATSAWNVADGASSVTPS